jgi:cytochrome c551/c552
VLFASTGYWRVAAARPQPQAPAPNAAGGEPTTTATAALLDTYCISCHNSRVRTAGLALDDVNRQTVAGNAQVWEKVVRKLRTGAMPPAGRPRPHADAVTQVVAALEGALDRGAAAYPNSGRPTVHRLNRTEYGNAIPDLLALEIDPRSLLPGDSSDQGSTTSRTSCRSHLPCSTGICRRRAKSAALPSAGRRSTTRSRISSEGIGIRTVA